MSYTDFSWLKGDLTECEGGPIPPTGTHVPHKSLLPEAEEPQWHVYGEVGVLKIPSSNHFVS